MKLTFEKDYLLNWYVILPDYEGVKSDLQMVEGADLMLDILAQDQWLITLNIDVEPNCNSELKLIKQSEDEFGATYKFESKHEFDVWLCNVTKFVFGYFPDEIYINKYL